MSTPSNPKVQIVKKKQYQINSTCGLSVGMRYWYCRRYWNFIRKLMEFALKTLLRSEQVQISKSLSWPCSNRFHRTQKNTGTLQAKNNIFKYTIAWKINQQGDILPDIILGRYYGNRIWPFKIKCAF